MQKTNKIQQFLRFKRQNPDWLNKVKKQRKQQQAQQKQIVKLTTRNNLKKKQLQFARKQYQKLRKDTQEVLYQMKNQQDQLDKQIESIQKKKMDEFRKTVVVEQKIEHLKDQIENLKLEINSKQKMDNQNIKNLQYQINKYKKLVVDVQQRVIAHQQWLNQNQSNRSSLTVINIPEIQADLQNIKKTNQSLIKQINVEQKRLKKQTEQIKRSYRDYCQKTDDKIKSWLKKCDSVLDQKKQIQVLLQGIDTNIPLQQMSSIQLLYKTQLNSLYSLYQPDIQKQLGDFFNPYTIKTLGTGIQKGNDKNANNASLTQIQEKKLNEMTEELNKNKLELFECQNYIESLKIRIDKYNKDIESTKQSIRDKKKH